MHLLSYLSDFLIPMLIFYVVSCGLAAHLPVYDIFVKGASRGGKTVLKVLPTLVGLMVSVGMLRASGFLDLAAELLAEEVRADMLMILTEVEKVAINFKTHYNNMIMKYKKKLANRPLMWREMNII